MLELCFKFSFLFLKYWGGVERENKIESCKRHIRIIDLPSSHVGQSRSSGQGMNIVIETKIKNNHEGVGRKA